MSCLSLQSPSRTVHLVKVQAVTAVLYSVSLHIHSVSFSWHAVAARFDVIQANCQVISARTVMKMRHTEQAGNDVRNSNCACTMLPGISNINNLVVGIFIVAAFKLAKELAEEEHCHLLMVSTSIYRPDHT